jgi:hypothetical protein
MKLDPKKGLLIDKRVLVKGLHSNFINVQIINGSKRGKCIYTPCNNPETSERSLLFTMRSQPTSGLAKDT